MALVSPLKITLYDPGTDEEKATYSRNFVPWKLLKLAVGLAKDVDFENMTPESVDILAALVVEVFGNKFSVQELDEGADVSEMITVLQAIVSRAKGLAVNPIPPEN